MGVTKWVIGGIVGGLIGAGIWAAIVYWTGYEVGWIAWGVGLLVGLGVRITAGEDYDGWIPGITAALIAVLAIVVGKMAAVWFAVAGLDLANIPVNVTPQQMIMDFADDIVDERIANKRRINWPKGVTYGIANKPEDFPPDIWREASQRWKRLNPNEQKKRIADSKNNLEQFTKDLDAELRNEAMRNSFSLFDILWFVLATLTAFKLGSGLVAHDD